MTPAFEKLQKHLKQLPGLGYRSAERIALNARERLGQARQTRKADAHLLVSAIGFAVILTKLFGGFDMLLKSLSVL